MLLIVCFFSMVMFFSNLIDYCRNLYEKFFYGYDYEICYREYGVRAIIFLIVAIIMTIIINWLLKKREKKTEKKPTKIITIKGREKEGGMSSKDFYVYYYETENGGIKIGRIESLKTTIFYEDINEITMVTNISRTVVTILDSLLTFDLTTEETTYELHVPIGTEMP